MYLEFGGNIKDEPSPVPAKGGEGSGRVKDFHLFTAYSGKAFTDCSYLRSPDKFKVLVSIAIDAASTSAPLD